MRSRTVGLIAVLALLGATPAGSTASTPVAHTSCTSARIAGASKCIQAGQFCARNSRAMRDYRRYGYKCTKRDRNGRYHLTYA